MPSAFAEFFQKSPEPEFWSYGGQTTPFLTKSKNVFYLSVKEDGTPDVLSDVVLTKSEAATQLTSLLFDYYKKHSVSALLRLALDQYFLLGPWCYEGHTSLSTLV